MNSAAAGDDGSVEEADRRETREDANEEDSGAKTMLSVYIYGERVI